MTIENVIIGGTHLCGHGHMAVMCPICPVEKERNEARAQLSRAEKVIEAARRTCRFQKGGTDTLREALAEYDRPSAPLDGRELTS